MAANLKENEIVRRRWGSRDKGTVTFAYGMGRVRVHWDTPNADGTPNVTVMQTRLLDRVDPDAAPTLDDMITAAPVDDTRQRISGYGFNIADTFKRPRLGTRMRAVRDKAFVKLCTATMSGNYDVASSMEDILFTIDHDGDDQYDAKYDDGYRVAYRAALTLEVTRAIRAQHPEWSP